ncbi:urotensin-related peptide 1 [Acanthopagrus schlegelii]
MISAALFYLLAVICSARWTHALPLYPDTNLEPQAGAKESVQQEKFANMVDNLKEAVMTLAAADKLRSQGFLRSEQNLPKTNKRACFWKYCVTN